ncbi:MAG TPA: antitoxin Xre/MbcA/ParS toxin-binding domain-containing protein [Steroidobacteraceae bacterium]|nr:antitoxin Xre/MbcA/ParS toxin-binding domain-containing protein [Steroidobacteraceae bacterium]
MQASTSEPQSRSRSREDRVVLARAVSKLFALWELSAGDQLSLLGLSETNRIALQRYAKGEALAANRDLLERVGHLLGIQKSLKLLYPHNAEIVNGWMSSPNSKFDGASPVEIVRKFGFAGLLMVRGTLDRMRGR